MAINFPVEDTFPVLSHIIVMVCFPAMVIKEGKVLISF